MHSPLPPDYYQLLLEARPLKLAIMGKDPFPSVPMGIPFCKPTWAQQSEDNCSGGHVLRSLGFSLGVLTTRFNAPSEFFYWMAQKRIGFLNLVYSYVGTGIGQKKHQQYLANGFERNRPILDGAENVVLCGEARKHSWNAPIGANYVEACHPDIRNRNNPSKAAEWHAFWGSAALASRFDLRIGEEEYFI